MTEFEEEVAAERNEEARIDALEERDAYRNPKHPNDPDNDYGDDETEDSRGRVQEADD